MGAAAYRRGSQIIRRRIEDEQKQPVQVSRAYLNRLERAQGENTDLQAEIIRLQAELKAQNATHELELKHAKIAYNLRVAERDVVRDELQRIHIRLQEQTELRRNYESKWLKCSAIIKIAQDHHGREIIEEYHDEAKHDYPHLWPDIERDFMGWPIKK